MGLKMIRKKGIYFTLDAFFATMLLIMGVILVTRFSYTQVSTEHIDLMSKDLLMTFGELKVGELKDEAPPAVEEKAKAELGMSVQEITPEIARQLQLKDTAGVIVTQVEAGAVAGNEYPTAILRPSRARSPSRVGTARLLAGLPIGRNRPAGASSAD